MVRSESCAGLTRRSIGRRYATSGLGGGATLGRCRASKLRRKGGRTTSFPIEDLDAIASQFVLGNEEAFRRVIGLFDGEMRRLAFVICEDPELAADASQNAWANAWRHRGALREPRSVRSCPSLRMRQGRSPGSAGSPSS